jgi:hypothetical protein
MVDILQADFNERLADAELGDRHAEVTEVGAVVCHGRYGLHVIRIEFSHVASLDRLIDGLPRRPDGPFALPFFLSLRASYAISIHYA